MKSLDVNEEQLQKMKTYPGFIAALDQSGGSTPGALRAYGIKDDAWSSEAEMFALVHQMRTRIITSPSFTGERILGAILFENTMDRDIEGQPTADYLWNVKRVVPFLKVDKGLAAEKSGVQLMKPMPELSALLDKAKAKRIFGTKMRSFVKQANGAGIKDVAQSGHPRGAQATAGRSARHAQAHVTGERRPLRRIRRSSQGREGGCAVGRLLTGRRQRALAEELRRRGQLFAGAGRRAVDPTIRC